MSDVLAGAIRSRYLRGHARVLRMVADLTEEQLHWRPTPTAHSIAFNLWHLARWADWLSIHLLHHLPERLSPGSDHQIWHAEELASRWDLESTDLGWSETGKDMDDSIAADLPLPSKVVVLDYARRAFAAAEQLLSTLPDDGLRITYEGGERKALLCGRNLPQLRGTHRLPPRPDRRTPPGPRPASRDWIGGTSLPLVRLVMRTGRSPEEKRALLDAVHAALVEAFKIPDDDRTQRIDEYASENFEVPPGRSTGYTLVEITAFPGRSVEAKRNLYQAITRNLAGLGVAPRDVLIVLNEPTLENWGVQGGRPASEVDLGFDLRA